MSGSTLQSTDFLLYSTEANWNKSVESILTQKIGKLTKSEDGFTFPAKFNPSLTISELELREAHLKNLKLKQTKWENARDKSRFPKVRHTRSLLRDEMEMLKINLSMQDKVVGLKDTQNFLKDPKKKRWKRKRLIKDLKKAIVPLQKEVSVKVRDLLFEIDGSESAKTDTVIWKFLKRGPSFRNEFITARRLFLELQAVHFPGLGGLSNSRFQNTQPVKVTCPNCGFFITTRTKRVSTVRTKLTSILFAIVGLCFLPHVIYTFKDTVHLCPLCEIYLGFCPAFGLRGIRRALELFRRAQKQSCSRGSSWIERDYRKMVSASSTSAKNLFVESKLRLSDRVQVNVNNIAAITRQIQRGSKANENLIAAAKNFALQEAAIDNSEANLKKLKLLSTHMNNQLDALHGSSSKMELVLEQVRSMQR